MAKTSRLEVRLTHAEKLDFEERAAEHGLTVSEWLRRLGNEDCDLEEEEVAAFTPGFGLNGRKET